jgi:ribosomal protein L35
MSKVNKSYTKRIRVTKNGKLVARTPGGNHFNGKESRKRQLSRKRGQQLTIRTKARTLFLQQAATSK